MFPSIEVDVYSLATFLSSVQASESVGIPVVNCVPYVQDTSILSKDVLCIYNQCRMDTPEPLVVTQLPLVWLKARTIAPLL